jgi:hypothetical protein
MVEGPPDATPDELGAIGKGLAQRVLSPTVHDKAPARAYRVMVMRGEHKSWREVRDAMAADYGYKNPEDWPLESAKRTLKRVLEPVPGEPRIRYEDAADVPSPGPVAPGPAAHIITERKGAVRTPEVPSGRGTSGRTR